MELAQVSIELIAIYFHSFEIFNIQIGEMFFVNQILLLSSQIIFRILKRPMLFEWFWSTSARNLRSRLTVAFAKCYFEVNEFKKIFIAFEKWKRCYCSDVAEGIVYTDANYLIH
jgi:hypothetical protein